MRCAPVFSPSDRSKPARCVREPAALEEHGDIDGAIRQAAAAGESGRAAELILGHSLKLINDGRVALLGQWIELVGPDLAERNPSLALARAWYGARTADPTMIASFDQGRRVAGTRRSAGRR